MATIIPARVIYTDEELSDILCTAVEGGIGYWSRVSAVNGGERYISVDLEPNEDTDLDFGTTTINLKRLQQAIDHIVAARETVNLRSDIVKSIVSGDPGDIDADGADAIVQFAMFGELVYG